MWEYMSKKIKMFSYFHNKQKNANVFSSLHKFVILDNNLLCLAKRINSYSFEVEISQSFYKLDW